MGPDTRLVGGTFSLSIYMCMYMYVSFLAVFCTQTATCLAPNLVIKPRSSLPDVTSMTTTNTSIEVRWTMPTLSECCTDVFSYPLVRYGYGVKPNFSEPEVRCTFTVCRVIIIHMAWILTIYMIESAYSYQV